MKNLPLPRLDKNDDVHRALLNCCRLRHGDVWEDPSGRHRIGCLDAADEKSVERLMSGTKAALAIQDPPYNLVAFEQRRLGEYMDWCRQWVINTYHALDIDGSLYVWLGADQNNRFQPLPDFMVMMRQIAFRSRSFITMRNQRGYGTQKNWMAVRQELLYYTKGAPTFNVAAEYTDIPKLLRGYYKNVGGELTENLERSMSDTIRAGNVWIDLQQVFYRLQENVSGCYAQKPLKSCERIIQASSNKNDAVIDFFSHSGTTLIAAETHERRCFTMDIDPVFCEITIRRLEQFRGSGKTGWQNSNPFEEEITRDKELSRLITKPRGGG